jgi:hypothetical protein
VITVRKLLRSLSLKSGYTLDYDKNTGKVTINAKQKRQSKGTSNILASAINEAVTSAEDVGIKTVSESKDKVEIIVDQFISRRMDIDDYRVINRDAPALATAVLTHVLVEYTTAAELPSVYNLETLLETSHSMAELTDFLALSDITQTVTVPRSSKVMSGAITAPPMTVRDNYYSIQYDMVFKSGANGNATQLSKVTAIK